MAWRSSAQSFFCTSPLEVLSIGAIEASKLLLHGNVLRKHSQRQSGTVADSFSHHSRSHPVRSKDQHSHAADRLSQWKHAFRRAVFSRQATSVTAALDAVWKLFPRVPSQKAAGGAMGIGAYVHCMLR